MSTSTTSDPLPVPALPRHHATPVQTGFAGPLPAVQKAEEELLLLEQQRRSRDAAIEADKSMEKEKQGGGGGGAVDLRGFAAGTASGITKLVVGKSVPCSFQTTTTGFPDHSLLTSFRPFVRQDTRST